jgi:hypothetical protein
MKKIIYSLLLLVIVITSACEKIVTNIDIPKVETQMVLFGFISPEENTINVELTLSKPIFGGINGKGFGAFEPIKDANVIITNESGQAVTLNYVDTAEAYQVSQAVYKIEPGRTYIITAVSPTKSIKAVCTVPLDTVSLTEFTSANLGSGSGNGTGPSFKYVCKWNDPIQKGNYYRLVIQQYYPNSPGVGNNDVYNGFFNDATQNGKLFSATCEDYWYQPDTNYREVYLINADIHYYEYMRRRVNYYGDDPFSEPFPQYTNVQNGLGVFCSFRRTKRSIAIAN